MATCAALSRPLLPHPASRAQAVRAISAEVRQIGPQLLVSFRADADGPIEWPLPSVPSRANGLWQTTCFELFVKSERHDAYLEFNLSPSGQWAAYRFAAYRDGMADLPVERAPRILASRDKGAFTLAAAIDARAFPAGPLLCGLSAVIEEQGGGISHWALTHPAERPDFHDPACFTAPLAAAPSA